MKRMLRANNVLRIPFVLAQNQMYIAPIQSKITTFGSQRFFKIYTKTGDKGTSALYTGDRLGKNDLIFECLGSIDEINANLGLAREHCL